METHWALPLTQHLVSYWLVKRSFGLEIHCNALGCPSPFSDQAILSTFWRRHFAQTNIC